MVGSFRSEGTDQNTAIGTLVACGLGEIFSINEARTELEAAQSALDAALSAWDESVSELWRTSLRLTEAQKRVTRAHELLRGAMDAADKERNAPGG